MERFTTNRELIQDWLSNHRMFPAILRNAEDEGWYDRPDTIEFIAEETVDFTRLEWDEFFEWMEYHNLALRYSDTAPPGLGAFEFVDRDRVGRELSPEMETLDTGDPEVVHENTIPDAE